MGRYAVPCVLAVLCAVLLLPFSAHAVLAPVRDGAVNLPIQSVPGSDITPTVATAGGTWVVVWSSTRGVVVQGDSDIFFTRSTDLGLTWPTGNTALHVDFETEEFADTRPAIATDGLGTWMVAWSRQDAGPHYSVSVDDGQTWSAPVSWYSCATSSLDVNVLYAGGRFFLAALVKKPEVANLAPIVGSTDDAGQTWHKAQMAPFGVAGLTLATDDGVELLASYTLKSDGTYPCNDTQQLAHSLDGGHTWSLTTTDGLAGCFGGGAIYTKPFQCTSARLNSGDWLVVFPWLEVGDWNIVISSMRFGRSQSGSDWTEGFISSGYDFRDPKIWYEPAIDFLGAAWTRSNVAVFSSAPRDLALFTPQQNLFADNQTESHAGGIASDDGSVWMVVSERQRAAGSDERDVWYSLLEYVEVPYVESMTLLNPLPVYTLANKPRIRVVFSEPVTGFDGMDDFTFTGVGVSSVTITGSGSEYEVEITPVDAQGTLKYQVKRNAGIEDSDGNAIVEPTPVSSTMTIDTRPLAVTVLQVDSPEQITYPVDEAIIRIGFNDTVVGFDIEDLEISANGVELSSVVLGLAPMRLNLSGIFTAAPGQVTVRLSDDATLDDDAGNGYVPGILSAVASFPPPPEPGTYVASITTDEAAETGDTDVSFEVTFAEPVINFDAADLVFDYSTAVVEISGGPAVYQVNFSNLTLSRSLSFLVSTTSDIETLTGNGLIYTHSCPVIKIDAERLYIQKVYTIFGPVRVGSGTISIYILGSREIFQDDPSDLLLTSDSGITFGSIEVSPIAQVSSARFRLSQPSGEGVVTATLRPDHDIVDKWGRPPTGAIPQAVFTVLPALEGEGEGGAKAAEKGELEGFDDGCDGVFEGEGEGMAEGLVEGEGGGEGFAEGEGIAEGEGETEGVIEGISEGVLEGEGAIEGVLEGQVDGEGAMEGEGLVEGEGIAEGLEDGEGVEEGVTDGEGEFVLPDVAWVLAGWFGAEANGDSRLSFSEFRDNLGGTREAFDAYDTNNDGRLSLPELQQQAIDGKPIHNADLNGDGLLDLSEALRVIQLYNAGSYGCAPNTDDTEDGFEPGGVLAPPCVAHAGDYTGTPDGVVSLSELLRLIQLFNFDSLSPCVSEDGFCKG